MPIFYFLALSELPRCKEKPQTVIMCFLLVGEIKVSND